MAVDNAGREMSAADLEREATVQRAQVRTTLDELGQRLSPGQLVDQALAHLRESSTGPTLASDFGRRIRENPIPVALILIGAAWIALARDRHEGERYEGERYEGERYGEDTVPIGGRRVRLPAERRGALVEEAAGSGPERYASGGGYGAEAEANRLTPAPPTGDYGVPGARQPTNR